MGKWSQENSGVIETKDERGGGQGGRCELLSLIPLLDRDHLNKNGSEEEFCFFPPPLVFSLGSGTTDAAAVQLFSRVLSFLYYSSHFLWHWVSSIKCRNSKLLSQTKKQKKSFSSLISAKLHFFIWYSVFTWLLPEKAKRTDKISILKGGQWNKKPKTNQSTTKHTKINSLQISLHNKTAFLPLLLFFVSLQT